MLKHPLYGLNLAINISRVIEKRENNEQLTISIVVDRLLQLHSAPDRRALTRRVYNCVKVLAEGKSITIETRYTPDLKLPYIVII